MARIRRLRALGDRLGHGRSAATAASGAAGISGGRRLGLRHRRTGVSVAVSGASVSRPTPATQPPGPPPATQSAGPPPAPQPPGLPAAPQPPGPPPATQPADLPFGVPVSTVVVGTPVSTVVVGTPVSTVVVGTPVSTVVVGAPVPAGRRRSCRSPPSSWEHRSSAALRAGGPPREPSPLSAPAPD